jgi:competence protein ComEC
MFLDLSYYRDWIIVFSFLMSKKSSQKNLNNPRELIGKFPFLSFWGQEAKRRCLTWLVVTILVLMGLFSAWWEWNRLLGIAQAQEEDLRRWKQEQEDRFLEVYFLNVTRGDAIFINYSNEYQILLDGGHKDNQVLRYLEVLMPVDDQRLELMMLSHAHQDHYKGFSATLEEYQVQRFVKNGTDLNEDLDKELNFQLERQNFEPERFGRGDSLVVDDFFRLDFLAPNKEKENQGRLDEDESSLVVRMQFGNSTFLMMGDATDAVEQELLASEDPLKADFLKVGHHGYEDASSEEFLEAVNPRYAIITPGSTPERIPGTIEKLERQGSEVYNLDQSGTAIVVCKEAFGDCKIK